MLAIQEFVSLFDSIRDANHYLTENLHLKIYKDILQIGTTALEDVYIYNKSTKSPPEDAIVQEANGLILNNKGEIVSMGFKNIYNVGKSYAAKIDYKNAEALLMDDGSLVVIYHYKGQWNIQTKYYANANETMRNSQITFRTAVTEVLKAMFNNRPFAPFDNYPNRDMCYVFEYVSPYNVWITPYHNSNMILLGVVHKGDLREMSNSWVDAWQVNYCKALRFMRPRGWPVDGVKEAYRLIPFVQSLRRGFVIKDYKDNRAKIVNPEYAFIERLISTPGELSPNLFASIALSENGRRIVYHYPQFEKIIKMYHDTLYELSRITTKAWVRSRHAEDKKVFAREVQEYPPIVKATLFMMRRNQVEHIEAAFKKIRPKKLTAAVKWRHGDKFIDELKRLEFGGF